LRFASEVKTLLATSEIFQQKQTYIIDMQTIINIKYIWHYRTPAQNQPSWRAWIIPVTLLMNSWPLYH